MCIGIPARVLRIVDLEADVDTGDGRRRRALLAAPEAIRRGDYVLLYANMVMSKIDRQSALESLGYMKEMAARVAEEDGLDPDKTELVFERRLRRLAGKARSRN